MDSSVIFLALSGLWLLYLLPGWLTRRHHAKQARVEDRFSQAMRTLEPRRDERPGRQTGRGYLLPRTVHEPHERSEAAFQRTSRPSITDQSVSQRRGDPRSPRRRRPAAVGLAFLFSLAAFPVLAGLALAGVVGWWLAGLPLITAGASLAMLNLLARHRVPRTHTPAGTARDESGPADRYRPGTVRTTAVESTPEAGWAGAETVLYDEAAIRAVERAAAVAAARAEAEAKEAARQELLANLKPGEWLPTEVPKPSYLLKPNAPRRPSAPRATIDVREVALDVRDKDGGTVDESLTWVDEHAPLRRASGN